MVSFFTGGWYQFSPSLKILDTYRIINFKNHVIIIHIH